VEKFLPTNTIWCFFDNFPWSKRGFNEKDIQVHIANEVVVTFLVRPLQLRVSYLLIQFGVSLTTF